MPKIQILTPKYAKNVTFVAKCTKCGLLAQCAIFLFEILLTAKNPSFNFLKVNRKLLSYYGIKSEMWFLQESSFPPTEEKRPKVWRVTHCLKITQNVAFEFWYFPPIFVLLKLNCLVTLFDRKIQVFKNSSKWNIFWHFCPL